MSQERLGRVNDEMLVYSFKKPTFDGRTEIYLTPLELLDRLSKLITPPRVHKHRYCGVLAPNAKLRRAVIESAGPAGATLQLLQEVQQAMGLEDASSSEEERKSRLGLAAAPPVIESILRHGGERTGPLAALPARSPPQGELAFDQDGGRDDWPEMDHSVDTPGDPWD